MTDVVIHPANERMKQLRINSDFKTVTAFAKFLGVSRVAWQRIEQGWPMSYELVTLLTKKLDVTTDYIYDGKFNPREKKRR